jgi:hypothetical protein
MVAPELPVAGVLNWIATAVIRGRCCAMARRARAAASSPIAADENFLRAQDPSPGPQKGRLWRRCRQRGASPHRTIFVARASPTVSRWRTRAQAAPIDDLPLMDDLAPTGASMTTKDVLHIHREFCARRCSSKVSFGQRDRTPPAQKREAPNGAEVTLLIGVSLGPCRRAAGE